MHVYFEHYHDSESKCRPGIPVAVNWSFDYRGQTRYIPTLYLFREGIVFDLITPLDSAEMERFFAAYSWAEETEPTDAQRVEIEQAHPYKEIDLHHVYINGTPAEGHGGSGALYTTLDRSAQHKRTTRDELVQAYPEVLAGVDHFNHWRFSIPMRGLTKARRLTLTLSAGPVRWEHPLGLTFDFEADETEHILTFVHPHMGVSHTVTFWDPQPEEMPYQNRTLYTTALCYEVAPELASGEQLQFDASCQISDGACAIGLIGQPRREEPTEESEQEEWAPESEGCAIIGGACGPTAIYVAGEPTLPRGPHGLPVMTCFAVPSLDADAPVRVCLQKLTGPALKEEPFQFSALRRAGTARGLQTRHSASASRRAAKGRRQSPAGRQAYRNA